MVLNASYLTDDARAAEFAAAAADLDGRFSGIRLELSGPWPAYGLSDGQIERMGRTLMALEERMDELREYFGLSPEDLNIDLGPLGPLLPRD